MKKWDDITKIFQRYFVEENGIDVFQMMNNKKNFSLG